MLADLRWLGLKWDDPPVAQSTRLSCYRTALEKLHAAGLIFPCTRSRRDVLDAASAPHEGGLEDEPIYPLAFRPPVGAVVPPLGDIISVNWRFRVPDDEQIVFRDGRVGLQCATAGRDLGDFLVWRKDGVPSYQLACAVDDAEMDITEVVRGDDLMRSTFRQILLLRALAAEPPAYWHCPLMLDEHGTRLAKRHDSLSLHALRERGVKPEEILATFSTENLSI